MSEDLPDPDDWVHESHPSDEPALRTALEEARRAYDNDIAVLNEIDEKAMRAGRTGLILIGVAVSALAVFGPRALIESSRTVFVLTTLGIGLVFCSTIFALGTYTATEYPSGIGENHRESVIQDGYSESEWLVFMLHEYGRWTDEVNEEIETNAELLENTMLLQLGGLLSMSVAVALGYLNQVRDIPPLRVFGAIIGIFVFVWIFALVLVGARKIGSSLMSRWP